MSLDLKDVVGVAIKGLRPDTLILRDRSAHSDAPSAGPTDAAFEQIIDLQRLRNCGGRRVPSLNGTMKFGRRL
jgi:hypothetical protein